MSASCYGNGEIEHVYDFDHVTQTPHSLPWEQLALPPDGIPWTHDNNQYHTHTSSLTPTGSLSSLCFPYSSGTGSSSGVPRSYSNTPLSSSNSSTVMRTEPSLQYETSNTRSLGARAANQTCFIVETPWDTQKKADKKLRSCIACYIKNRKCGDDDVDRCSHCRESTAYCKGSINTPDLFNIDRLLQTAAAILAERHQYQSRLPASQLFNAFDVSLHIQRSADLVPVETYRIRNITIPRVDRDFQFCSDAGQVEIMLKTLFAHEPGTHRDFNTLSNLDRYKSLCHRFRLCTSYLRSLDFFTVDAICINDPRVLRLVLGLICLLCRRSSDIFIRIFHEIRACFDATRERRRTLALMANIVDGLYDIGGELGLLEDFLLPKTHSMSLFYGLSSSMSAVRGDLQNLADGLLPKPLGARKHASLLDTVSIHFSLPFPPNVATPGLVGSNTPKDVVSFVQVLECFTGISKYHNHNSIPASASNPPSIDTHMAGMGQENSTVNNERFVSRSQFAAVQHVDDRAGSTTQLGTTQPSNGLSDEASAKFDLDWTFLPLDGVSMLPFESPYPTQPQHQLTLAMFDNSQPKPRPREYPHSSIQHCVAPYPPVGGATMSPFRGVMNVAPRSTLVGSIAGTTAQCTDTSSPSPNGSDKKHRKRKRNRLSGLLAGKKQYLPRPSPTVESSPIQHTPPVLSKATPKQSQPVDPAPTNRNGVLNKTLNGDQIWPTVGRSPAMDPQECSGAHTNAINNRSESGEAIFNKMKKRHESWPLMHHVRKSRDLSVSVLTKPFEKKLRIDVGQNL